MTLSRQLVVIALVWLIGFLLITAVRAETVNVLIYVNARVPQGEQEKEHWKAEIPNLGVGEVIRHFRVVAKQGQKRLYHAAIKKSSDNKKQFSRIKAYIETYNNGKTIQNQILYWWGRTALKAYTALWVDRTTDPFIELIAKKIIQYPIRAITKNEDHPIKATIEEAETTYGLTIKNTILQKCGDRCIPHKFFGM